MKFLLNSFAVSVFIFCSGCKEQAPNPVESTAIAVPDIPDVETEFEPSILNTEVNHQIEMSTDNPESLIGTPSTDLSILGIKLGMSWDEAWDAIDLSDSIWGEVDEHNASRIRVFLIGKNGTLSDDNAMYLIWEPDGERMRTITIFNVAKPLLSKSFRRLFTFEAVDAGSDFMRSFIGYHDSQSVEHYDYSDWFTTTYVYEGIGLEVYHKDMSGREEITIALSTEF